MSRTERVHSHERELRWRRAPVTIDTASCIECDRCVRTCPPAFGAIFHEGVSVVVLPELCSGCGKCVDACPAACIHDAPDWEPTGPTLWEYVGTVDDPYCKLPLG